MIKRMTKQLRGDELAGFIKERQAKQVRGLRQAWHTFPKLVILKTPAASAASEAYVRMKRAYGEDILIETVVDTVPQAELAAAIERYNGDETVHGIIVQLPLDDPTETDELVNLIDPAKDVDGLGSRTTFDSATAEAINWLLTGYGVELTGRPLAIVGNGRLVGAPLVRLWQASGYDVTVCDETTPDLGAALRGARVIVTATGVPRLLTADMVPAGAVVVDAGTASENGKLVGDLDESVRERGDLLLTPERGGVGPLTIAALYDHVISAALATVPADQL